MTVETELMDRANGQCELCAATESLSTYVLPGANIQGLGASVVVCATCRGATQQPSAVSPNHWYALKDSIWSEHTPVKVLAYRILKGLKDQPRAQDLLSQIYLDDDALVWADAGDPSAQGDGETLTVIDSNGTQLLEGDTVTLIKDLVVKGANFTAKRGTVVKGINLTDDPKYIEGRVNGTRIVLVAAYLKKA